MLIVEGRWGGVHNGDGGGTRGDLGEGEGVEGS